LAKIEELNVTLSEAVIQQLLAQAKADDPTKFTDEYVAFFSQRFARQQKVTKITPLKAGKTSLLSSRGGRGGSDAWGSANASVSLTIEDYTNSKFAAGESRYKTEGEGNLKACYSCHGSGAEGAPSHQLGRISQISDKDALTWITTGKLPTRTARIAHAWEFRNDDEKVGIVQYLREIQTNDVDELTKLTFQEMLANDNGTFSQFQGRNGPQQFGPPAPSPSSSAVPPN
jgi:mono/diheme cytochrome c family protein